MSEPVLPFILATAGHVDHGKSSLVRALTGTDPDRLPEEKTRGLTIELGFASLDLTSPRDVGTSYRLGVVDVPGHEDFVKNMVAGVGSIDVALLVVAADDGWMPQTEEHLQILTYLGVRHGVVALTKADLVPDEQAAVRAVRTRLNGSFLATAPVVPTSATDGRGLDALRRAIADVLASLPPRRDIARPRLPIDRAFTLPGVGTIVTGTLTGGSLQAGQTVLVQPGGASARIRSIQSHNQVVDLARPGSRVALNLSGVRPADAKKPAADAVHRGEVVTLPGLGHASETLDVELVRLERNTVTDAGKSPPLRNGTRVHVHHGAAAFSARVHLLDRPRLGVGERCLAQLQLERAMFAFAGDRFVLRDWSGQHTLAGGLILDPMAERHARRRPVRRRVLEAVAAAADSPDAWVRAELARHEVLPKGELLAQSVLHPDEVRHAVERLAVAEEVVPAGPFLFAAGHWRELASRATSAVDRIHADHPERPGLPLTELRAAMGEGTPVAVADAVVAGLCADGFRRTGTVIRRSSHQPRLPARLAAAGERLRQRLSSDPFNPPSRPDLAPDTTHEQALRFLIINGEVIELTPACVIAESAMHAAIAQVRERIAHRGPATVSQLKMCLGSSRRIMVPLLEHFDRLGITRRDGDHRVLGTSPA